MPASSRRSLPVSCLGLAIAVVALIATCPALTAQTARSQPSKPVASVRFGANGSDPQGTKDPNERVLQGKVQDPNGKPIKGALVYLKDKSGSPVKSMAADDTGAYRFAQLAQSKDYEVWAQLDQKKGRSKTISSFDSNKDIVLNLKIEQ